MSFQCPKNITSNILSGITLQSRRAWELPILRGNLNLYIEKVCAGAGLIAEAATDDMLTLAIYDKVRTSYNMNMQGQGVILPKQVCAG